MKTLILCESNTIKLIDLNPNKHFVAFKSSVGTYGYLVLDLNGFVISANALVGPTWNRFHVPDNITVNDYIRLCINDSKFEFYIFEDRKEFFTFLAEHSK